MTSVTCGIWTFYYFEWISLLLLFWMDFFRIPLNLFSFEAWRKLTVTSIGHVSIIIILHNKYDKRKNRQKIYLKKKCLAWVRIEQATCWTLWLEVRHLTIAPKSLWDYKCTFIWHSVDHWHIVAIYSSFINKKHLKNIIMT